MIELYDYQVRCAADGTEIIKQHGIVYVAGEPRCGKTHIGLTIAQNMDAKRVLFITKANEDTQKSVRKDYNDGEYDFDLILTTNNHVTIGKIPSSYPIDVVIVDEAHAFGAFPKPSARTVAAKKIIGSRPLIFLSGTPSPETHVQFYHQFWMSDKSPWLSKKNFYYWAACGYVKVKMQYIANQKQVKNYDTPVSEKIMSDINKYMVTQSQKDAGFEQVVRDEFITVQCTREQADMIATLKRDKIVTFPNSNEVILGDTAVKMLMKMRQLYSGTIKFESGEAATIATEKVKVIKERFAGKKIAIYTCFIQEYEMLKKHFPNWTNSAVDFNKSNNLVYVSNIVSGREGVNINTADAIVIYTPDFSATSYWQVRQRAQHKDRKTEAVVYWLISDALNGKPSIEDLIYRAISKKKNYTSKIFEKEFGIRFEKIKSIENAQKEINKLEIF